MASTTITEADKARAIRDAAGELHISLHLSGNTWNRAQQDYLFKLCNAIIDLIDDGDALAERETLMDYLRIDEDGNPVRDDSPNDTFWRDSFHAINAGMGEAA